ncbi:NUDIX hydrolase [Crossiella sp. SN42]|uniref:NUDIX domain-containing protein n=1 Tax=Crossiella sp. SN42 TaxID=2944808 RepID=UPI00207CC38D|nr:NUDIX hydrolase [Crossiella sp. SN42]MCO1581220.1 NUDIX hydrolase [Crossiella sp. SN42]
MAERCRSETISLTADIIVLATAGGQWHVLLIQRGHEPFAGRWALPGGYVDPGETSADAAIRELREETNVVVPKAFRQVGAYDEPGRDPRGRVVSVAYLAVLTQRPTATAGDDAAAAQWVPVEQVVTDLAELAFDHGQILSDALDLAGLGPAF